MFETWGFLLLHVYTPIQHVILRIFILQWCHTTRLLSLLHYIYLTAIITRFEMQCKHMISFSNMIICLSVSAGLLFVMEENLKSCYCFQYFCQVLSLFVCFFQWNTNLSHRCEEAVAHDLQVLTHQWHLIISLSLPNSIHPGHASSQGKASHSECWQEFRLNQQSYIMIQLFLLGATACRLSIVAMLCFDWSCPYVQVFEKDIEDIHALSLGQKTLSNSFCLINLFV